MIRRSVTRAAAVAAGLCLWWGASSLYGATVATVAAEPSPLVIGTTSVPSIGVDYGLNPGAIASFPPSTNVLGDGAAAVATTASDPVATIPLPPSAYPGMVGLATAALSVWRYRRRRR